jgi:NAD(P)-dependent dehydrogenase (short-subunit alcohol dehydrogenase family)
MQFDVSDEAQCKALVAKTLERFGKIDILVNNAALYAPLEPVPVTDIDVALWDKVMAINVRGLFMMTKHVAPHMIARKYGKIINIGSGTAARGIPDFAHYVTSKGAVTAFTRAVSRELGQHGICVNTLAPGLTISGAQNQAHLDQSRASSLARRAIKRDQVPEDLVGTLIYLASKDSDFLTGQVLAVDGGANNT